MDNQMIQESCSWVCMQRKLCYGAVAFPTVIIYSTTHNSQDMAAAQVSTHAWIGKQTGYICAMEYYSATGRMSSSVAAWQV